MNKLRSLIIYTTVLCPVDDATSSQMTGCLGVPAGVNEGGGRILCPFAGQFNVRMIVHAGREKRIIKSSETVTVED